MPRPLLRLLPLTLLLVLLAASGCGKSPPTPMVWVLKEGVFTVTPDKPFTLSNVIEGGGSNREYEIIIEVKVTSGDAVTVTTLNTKPLSGQQDGQRPRLSTTTPVKEIKLTDQLRESAESKQFNITVSSAGKTSDVSIKVTKLLK